MNKIKLFSIFTLIAIIFLACEDRSDLTAPSVADTGTADFTRFVSIGNSLTAGYQSSALYKDAQIYSFGNLIAEQVGADYEQPYMSGTGIGGRIDIVSLDPFSTTTQSAGDASLAENLNYAGIYNNLGIPGSLLPDLLYATSAATSVSGSNVFFDLILRGQGTVVDQVLLSQPTFATLWIGNNDILGYATSGGTLPHTPEQTFAFLYDQLCDTLASAGIPVVLANIPDVTTIPFFTTVGGQLLLSGVTAVYGTKSDGSVALLDLTQNLLTLRAQDEIGVGKGFSSDNPLSNEVILDSDEIAIAKTVTASFNASISSIASKYGFHLVDINSFFNNVAQNGFVANGVAFSTIYVTGGIFSLDGVHPTSQGYAIIANEFIKVINENFNASIPEVNVSTIPGSLKLSKSSLGKDISEFTLSPGSLNNFIF